MIKFNKTLLFILFATSLFLLGVNITYITLDGFGKGRELFIELINLFILSSSAYLFYKKLSEVNNSKK
ncbi:hypothetical protein [Flavobacterium aestivum]|uniref:hypothetical protein n=1 Tax=Flavobacterium aestivum TaxID=3003257 RepID=UPI0022857569|nr:hypothetical protein [Flavobacterium aestivum]